MAIDLSSDVIVLSVFFGALAALLVWLLRRSRARRQTRQIVIDGSNVLYWMDDTPRLDPLVTLIAHLQRAGFQPGVVFDANVGYLIAGHYLDDRPLARMLRLPEDRVLVVPKGMQADGALLQYARDTGAPIVTNDRFRDWAAQYPEVTSPGTLVRGGYRDGVLWLDMIPGKDPGAGV